MQRHLDDAALLLAQQAEQSRPSSSESREDAPASPREKLHGLRQILAEDQIQTEAVASSTPLTELNDARIVFHDAAQGAAARVEAWWKKWLPDNKLDGQYAWPSRGGDLVVLPSSYVAVHLDEPLSVVAYTLSLAGFQRAVQARSTNLRESFVESPAEAKESLVGSNASRSVASSVHSAVDEAPLDPDDPAAVFYRRPAGAVSVTKTKRRTKDASLLTFNKLRRMSSRQREEEGEHATWPPRRNGHPHLGPVMSASLRGMPEGGGGADPGDDSGTPVTPYPDPSSPHVKHTVVKGSIKISCTAWHAPSFARLRALWGVSEEGFVTSLSHCTNWAAGGGKSSAAFFRSEDDKLVAKQLQAVWTMDETETFLDFAPSYLQYASACATNGQDSLLARILGVYSVKIKDAKGRTPRRAMNLMVLENVFARTDLEGHALLRFDLKGIRERRVKQASFGSDPETHVWHDAEWIEEMRCSAFLPSSEKDKVLRALGRDLAFLVDRERMDYSLLVAVCGAQIRVRLVDYLGAYTWGKQLESTSKRVLKSPDGKHSVTILPPAEYAERLQTAVREYFVSCPTGAGIGDDEERPLPAVL